MRITFIDTLCSLAKRDERIWLICGDLGYSVLERFIEQFPDRYINAGVAEQNMTGLAAGLASSGKIVFTYSIANFATLRCLEQIRNDVCYHNLPVKVVSVGGGFSYGQQGYTHHGLEDLGIMRMLPNMKVMSPADPVETRFVTEHACNTPGPCYLRLGKSKEDIIHETTPDFKPDKVIETRKGEQVLLIATGTILEQCHKAADILNKQGVSCAVWSCPFVKPFDSEALRHAAKRYKVIATVEEGQKSGGLSSPVAEIIASSKEYNAIHVALGVDDAIFYEALSQSAARAQAGLLGEHISKVIVSKLN